MLYTRLDQDRDEALTLQELSLFMSRTFALFDKTKDCVVDLDDVISTLDEGKLPNGAILTHTYKTIHRHKGVWDNIKQRTCINTCKENG